MPLSSSTDPPSETSPAAAEMALIGGRRFWVTSAPVESLGPTFARLQAQFDADGDGPIGLCALVDDPAERRHRPEAVWSDPPFVYAGFLPGGRQVRIAYFAGARISGRRGPASASPPPPAKHDQEVRIAPLAEQEVVDEAAILELWVREAGLPPAEARRRLDEVLVVASDARGRLVGVSTAYLHRQQQLHMDLWHFRGYVREGHRGGAVALRLAMAGRDRLRERFVSGQDLRAAGVIFEVEHPGLRARFDQAVWPRTDFTYIGDNQAGVPVRVHFFPGALAPEPPA